MSFGDRVVLYTLTGFAVFSIITIRLSMAETRHDIANLSASINALRGEIGEGR